MNSVIILAAGTGSRSGLGYNKMLYQVQESTILEITINKFIASKIFAEIIVVVNKSDLTQIKTLLKGSNIKIIVGGKNRSESVYLGVCQACSSKVWIHDGARPFITKAKLKEMNDIVQANLQYDCFTLATPVVDTLAIVKNDVIEQNLERETLRALQTPQIVTKSKYLKLFKTSLMTYTDESSLFVAADQPVMIIDGMVTNRKITSAEDIRKLENNEFSGDL